MSILEIIIIALAESMDCFAVAISTGLSKHSVKYGRAIIQAISFGVFQGGMTLIGYFIGNIAERWFYSVGHAIACTILCVLGVRMLISAKSTENAKFPQKLTIMNIFLLSIATSIDALAVGVSFAFININMAFPVSAITLASFVMGILGFCIGKCSSKRFKTKAPEIIAGIILIAIGLKILIS